MRGTGDAGRDDARIVRNIGKWMAAFALFLVLAATLLSLQLYQVTAEGPSRQTLRRAIAATTEIDVLLQRNYDDLQLRAEASDAGEVLTLRDYPINVTLTRDEALGASREELRELLLSRSAAMMYEDGTSLLRDDGGGRPGRFNAAGLIDSFLDVLRDGAHTAFGVTTFVLAALSTLLALTLAALCRGFGRLVAVGAVTVAASLPLLLIGLLARWSSSTDGDTEYIEREMLAIGESLAWLPIRNGLAFVAFGAILLIAGVAAARISDARTMRHDGAIGVNGGAR